MNYPKLALLFSLLFIILIFRFASVFYNQPKLRDGQYISFKTTLLSEPILAKHYQAVTANIDVKNKLLVRASLYPQLHYGDSIRISGNLKSKLLANGKTVLIMYFPKIEVKEGEKNVLLATVSFIRQKITALFLKTLPPTSASLLLGIVFGIRENIPKEFANKLQEQGVLHVTAASGMNVSMVAGFLTYVFALFLKRQYAVVASIFGICFYALLAGLSPSIIRASIMGILAFSSQILGRERFALYSLLMAAYVMLFASPILIFDLGFQLSFMATMGLISIRSLFEKFRWINILKRSIIGESLVTTISAQTATLPILIGNFGYSPLSIIVNGLVLLMIPTLMVLGGLGGIIGIVYKPIGAIFLYLSLPFLLYFQKVIDIFTEIGRGIHSSQTPWQFSVGYYSLLLGILLYFYRRK